MKCRKCGAKLDRVELKDDSIGYRCPNGCIMPI